jgi:DNA adenine methylase
MIRTPIRYYGSKAKLSKWILGYLPKSKLYVEPFGGSLAVLFAREPLGIEVVNDLDSRLHTLYTCLKDDDLFCRFQAKVEATLYSRQEYEHAHQVLGNPLQFSVTERAWAAFLVYNMAINPTRPNVKQWSFVRSGGGKGGASVSRWNSRVDILGEIHARLRHVQVECKDYWEVMQDFDGSDTLHYADPPYHPLTRKNPREYPHEMSHEQHVELVDRLLLLNGMVALSGYQCAAYDKLILNGWRVVSCPTTTSAGKVSNGGLCNARVESLYLNPRLCSKITNP